jgi:3-isopropylmalate/(R)-2-methylmalate dehydratase small subunit
MTKYTAFESKMVAIPLDNIDTDQIIPARFLKVISKDGLGDQLFCDWRYDSDGKPKPDFILNQPESKARQILLAGDNFGCGSSREHAPWALGDYGFRAIIAPSFADIFFNNCFKNGLLPIVLPEADVERLFHDAAAFPGFKLTIDLERQTVATTDGGTVFRFDVDAFRKHCLLNGLDDIALTLTHADEIRAFEAKRKAEQPWLF